MDRLTALLENAVGETVSVGLARSLTSITFNGYRNKSTCIFHVYLHIAMIYNNINNRPILLEVKRQSLTICSSLYKALKKAVSEHDVLTNEKSSYSYNELYNKGNNVQVSIFLLSRHDSEVSLNTLSNEGE